MPSDSSHHRGFTLLELLVVIAILSVLVALLFPFIARAMERGRTAKCANFMNQLGAASIRYAGENQMNLPATSHQRKQGLKSWTITLQPYAEGTLCFRCPCDEDAERPYTYVMNDFLTPNPAGAPDLDLSKLSRLESQRVTVLFAEASKTYENSDHFHFSDYYGMAIPPAIFKDQVAVERHDASANYVFADGHVETLSWEKVQKLLREPGNRLIDPTAQ